MAAAHAGDAGRIGSGGGDVVVRGRGLPSGIALRAACACAPPCAVESMAAVRRFPVPSAPQMRGAPSVAASAWIPNRAHLLCPWAGIAQAAARCGGGEEVRLEMVRAKGWGALDL
eukprot:gene8316-1582_t